MAQVARDTLQKAKGFGGYSAIQVVMHNRLLFRPATAHLNRYLPTRLQQVDAFFSSLMMIVVSELGDKTVTFLCS